MSFIPPSHNAIPKSNLFLAVTTDNSHHISASSIMHSVDTTGSHLSHSVLSSDDDIPRSVRGAAPEQRRLIRKRQNSESAKRCRQRKKLQVARTAAEMQLQTRRVHRLEALVQHLSHRLHEAQSMIEHISAARAPESRTDAQYDVKIEAAKVGPVEKNAPEHDALQDGTVVQVQELQTVLGGRHGADADSVALAFKVDELVDTLWV